MKVIFLIITFSSLIFSVQAQRNFTQYTCSVSHKQAETAFYLNLGETRDVEVGGWQVQPGIKRDGDLVTVSLSRTVNVMDATYKKDATRSYPLNARTLPVELEHAFGGATDIFTMVCYPRDP